ncbi:uncharacterized protein K489DRAFT_377721 [Dissoconium aciculare CBS 342.82]|uniref:Uncharacterized protein n=1 Tax=Dissoconium aciculare CBS 342.82 TaxID=1314786 RepID=A0A6J3MC36_9PEZI|nr:uncharacterized protein K489DRAFT_377721 [Dissoconium aciculare CBS 342.82]KAF1825174.1 hypothetical protein K489DRAFT_377721 [Dissoconium aciculare CBS 342.82]
MIMKTAKEIAMEKPLRRDHESSKSFTVRRVIATFLGAVFYLLCNGLKNLLRYRGDCIDGKASASDASCRNKIFTITLAHILFAIAGYIYGGHWDRERSKNPETRRREAARVDEGMRRFDVVMKDTSRLGLRLTGAVLAAAIFHAFGSGSSELERYIDLCSGELWDASPECYVSFAGIIVSYPFFGLVGFLAAVTWELCQGIVPRRRE